ncbi:MAG TPA: nucleotide exchange factor GrpE [Actinomycetota bacterium]
MSKDPTRHGEAPHRDGPAGASPPTPPGAPGEAAEQAEIVSAEVVEDDPRSALERERDEARAEAASHLDDLKRLKAEFENYRKRMVREQTQLAERAALGLIDRLLAVLDNFQLALLAADQTTDYEKMVRGVELVYAELLDVLEKEGLERIEAVGRPFDPERHEAVMRAEGDGDELLVLDEMRPGYLLRGRVLRPAMVKVGPRRPPDGGNG